MLAPQELYDIPPDDTVLWRYMDLASLLWMLSEKALLFTWPINFEDAFEGQFTRQQVEEMRAWEGEVGEQNRSFFASSPFPIAVSCWHEHPAESAIMWKAYGGTASVAVRTSVGNVRASLPSGAIISRIKYIDHEVDTYDYGNVIHPYVHKRLVYQHEQEVRVMLVGKDAMADDLIDCGQKGIAHLIKPDLLLDEIVVGPQIGAWFTGPLQKIAADLGFAGSVRASRVSDEPYLLYKQVSVTALVPWELADKVTVPRYIHIKAQPESNG